MIVRFSIFAFAMAATGAVAQPADLPIAAATTTQYPPGVKVLKRQDGAIYVDARGQTLYGLDMRTILRWNPDPAKYCGPDCARDWQPLLAPAGSQANIRFPKGFGGQRGQETSDGFVQNQKAPDWTVIDGADGPQWVYKGWHMVFTRKAVEAGSIEFDGVENRIWNTLKFVPPVPEVVAPAGVKPVFADGAYVLADKDGRALFTGRCKTDCDSWMPLAGGMASAGLGNWTIDAGGETAQWAYRGKPVFVSRSEVPAVAPPGGKLLRP